MTEDKRIIVIPIRPYLVLCSLCSFVLFKVAQTSFNTFKRPCY